MPLLLPLALLLAAPPAAEVVPSSARPGDALLVRVAGTARPPSGTLAGRPLSFWRAGGEWRALAALPIETPPGPAAALLVADGARVEAPFSVVEPGFASRTLSVAPEFIAPPARVRRRIARDRKAFQAAYARPFAPPLFRAGFEWPRRARVTARYGDQRVFNGEAQSVHYGLDLAGPRGAPVRAANDGVVVLARDAYLSGKSVVLWHGADVYTVYFHLDRMDVRPGREVRKGTRIGVIGSTGRSTGPHLHWSVRVAGLYVDPESLVGIDFGAGAAPPRPEGPPASDSPEGPSPPPPPGRGAPPADATAAPTR